MAATYTNFCTRSGGSNMNAGAVDGSTTEPATTALVTYTGGDWTSTTDIYIAPIGADMTEAVVGRFASLYHDGDTTPTTNQHLVARITAVVGATRSITLSTTARALLGTEVATGVGNRSLSIGGAWAGPATTVGFPLNFAFGGLANAAGDSPRLNMKSDATYSITAAISLGTSNCSHFAGYTSSYADGGRAVIDGGTSGASYVLVTLGATATTPRFVDFEFKNNGATGSANGVAISNGVAEFTRCVFRDVRGSGANITTTGNNSNFIECEFYGCNQSNTASQGGLTAGGSANLDRCFCHDNAGSNSHGARLAGAANLHSVSNSVFDTNGAAGLVLASANSCVVVKESEFYANTTDGITCAAGMVRIENCNFIDNGGWGVLQSSGTFCDVRDCGFGAGTAANTSGTTSLTRGLETDSVTYAADTTPYTAPTTGNFSIIASSTGKGAGRGTFLQTAASYTGTVGYPTIGAAPPDPTLGGQGISQGLHTIESGIVA